jgi:hypothetical protein
VPSVRPGRAAPSTLADHAQFAFGQIEVAQIQAHQLGQTQTGRIEQLDHGRVADPERVVVHWLEQGAELIGVEGMRQGARALGRADTDGRIGQGLVLPHQPAVEPAQAGEFALEGLARDALTMAPGGIAPDTGLIEPLDRAHLALVLGGKPGRDLEQVVPIGAGRMLREPSLVRQVCDEALDQGNILSARYGRFVWVFGHDPGPIRSIRSGRDVPS